ncbi:hypothetical protein QFZ82_002301 [Streptomyces sp. V4I23]|nr:hypothetical protein [Streptomyces sp. V4I23]
MPEPKPSSWGRYSHWMQVCSTNRIPHNRLPVRHSRPPLGQLRPRLGQRLSLPYDQTIKIRRHAALDLCLSHVWEP